MTPPHKFFYGRAKGCWGGGGANLMFLPRVLFGHGTILPKWVFWELGYQNFDKGSRKDFIECVMRWKENEKADGEGDKEEDVSDEKVGERLGHILEHLNVFAESRYLANQKHLKKLMKQIKIKDEWPCTLKMTDHGLQNLNYF